MEVAPNIGVCPVQDCGYTTKKPPLGTTCPVHENRALVSEKAKRRAARDVHHGDIVGALLGRPGEHFAVLDILGSGAMGAVYRAWSVGLSRSVAIKVIRADQGSVDKESLPQRFANEAKALAAIPRHPAIVEIYDYGNHDGQPYMVLEWVPGQSLARLLKQSKTLPPAQVADITLNVLSALSEAHRHRIIHRDLKPGNIMMVSSQDDETRLKVLDFGIAKLLWPDRTTVGGEEAPEELTMANMAMGTPAYMPPEQLGGATVGPRADLYSLGIMMYRLLAGVAPFQGDLWAVIDGHRNRQLPPFLPQLEIPQALTDLILRATAKQPSARYASASAMAAALREIRPLLGNDWGSGQIEELTEEDLEDPESIERALSTTQVVEDSEETKPAPPKAPPPIIEDDYQRPVGLQVAWAISALLFVVGLIYGIVYLYSLKEKGGI